MRLTSLDKGLDETGDCKEPNDRSRGETNSETGEPYRAIGGMIFRRRAELHRDSVRGGSHQHLGARASLDPGIVTSRYTNLVHWQQKAACIRREAQFHSRSSIFAQLRRASLSCLVLWCSEPVASLARTTAHSSHASSRRLSLFPLWRNVVPHFFDCCVLLRS